jgi:hypothetical protein
MVWLYVLSSLYVGLMSEVIANVRNVAMPHSYTTHLARNKICAVLALPHKNKVIGLLFPRYDMRGSCCKVKTLHILKLIPRLNHLQTYLNTRYNE